MRSAVACYVWKASVLSESDNDRHAQDGMVTPPPILEEGSVLLNEKRSWLPFAGQPKDEGGTFKPGGPGYQKD